MAAAKKRPSRLGSVTTGAIVGGTRFCLYGPEAVGKSTLASCSRAPIFADIEDGTSWMDVPRYPYHEGPGGHVPRSFTEVLDGVVDLIHNPHDYGTLVIDTADRLETLIWDYMCQRDSGARSPVNKGGKKLTSIESYGYGKGFNLALDEWARLCRLLDRLRVVRGMDIIILGHAAIRTFKNPAGDDYDRYNLRLNDRAAGFIKEWCDVVGFVTFEEFAARPDDDERQRVKGYSTGRRLLMLERTAAYDAKSRVPGAPDRIELATDNPWAPVADMVERGRSMTPDQVWEQIRWELDRISDPDLTTNVFKAKESANGDVAVLYRYLVELRRRPASKEETIDG